MKLLRRLLIAAALGSHFFAAAEPLPLSTEKKMLARAQEIILPQLELKDATVEQALTVIQEQARQFDPLHVGVQIEFKPEISPPDLNPPDAGITISLTEIPVSEAIKHIIGLSSYKYRITPTGFRVVPISEPAPLETRVISLVPEVFNPSLSPDDLGGIHADVQKIRADLKSYLTARGVQFPSGTSCLFDEEGMKISSPSGE